MRRTGIGTLGNPGEEVLRKVADVAARELRWDKEKTEKEIAAVVHLLKIPVD
jgi:glycerol-3-phosphate dehydrogenase